MSEPILRSWRVQAWFKVASQQHGSGSIFLQIPLREKEKGGREHFLADCTQRLRGGHWRQGDAVVIRQGDTSERN